MSLCRTTSDPGATCPEDLYSSEELAHLDHAADLREQIAAIDRKLFTIDQAIRGADMAGDNRQVSWLESQYEDLVPLRDDLLEKYRRAINWRD